MLIIAVQLGGVRNISVTCWGLDEKFWPQGSWIHQLMPCIIHSQWWFLPLKGSTAVPELGTGKETRDSLPRCGMIDSNGYSMQVQRKSIGFSD